MVLDMAMMKVEDRIQIEKKEADENWDFVMSEVAKGNLDAIMIALAMKRCNEVDMMIFKYEYDDNEE